MSTQLQPTSTVATPAMTSPAGAPRARGWFGSASEDVAHFLHQLRRIPAATWLELTVSRLPDSGSDAADDGFDRMLEEQADFAARRRLHTALETMPAVVRRITRRIDTDLAVFHGIIPELPLQRMRRAAHLAAFTLAAQQLLHADDVARLYRPFAELVPIASDLRAD